jgi:hypothetical protein
MITTAVPATQSVVAHLQVNSGHGRHRLMDDSVFSFPRTGISRSGANWLIMYAS